MYAIPLKKSFGGNSYTGFHEMYKDLNIQYISATSAMEHVCPRCDYRTHKKTHFVKHITQRKTLCPAIVADVSLDALVNEYSDHCEKVYKCSSCARKFNSRSGLSYHKNSKCNNLNERITSMENMLHQIAERLAQSPPQNITVNNNSTTTVNVTNTGNVTNNILLNSFGSEYTNHITSELSSRCLNKGIYGIIDMLDLIYFNENIPQNHNVKLKSLKNMLVEVFKDSDWETRDFVATVDNMISASRNHLMKDIDYQQLSDNIDMMNKVNKLMCLPTRNITSMRNHTKAKLVNRRENAVATT
jgi:ribosomal protein L37AE/L43A